MFSLALKINAANQVFNPIASTHTTNYRASMQEPAIPFPTPSIKRRLASMSYEVVLLSALWITAGFLFLAFHKDTTAGAWQIIFRVYLIVVTGVYFVSFWRWGQTLPMKTWRIRLVDAQGRPPRVPLAILRYLLAVIGLCFFGVGLLWALLDRDRQFLHDRILGLRLTDTNSKR
jgi:uncharacterized RDD family membrane protein YckC